MWNCLICHTEWENERFNSFLIWIYYLSWNVIFRKYKLLLCTMIASIKIRGQLEFFRPISFFYTVLIIVWHTRA